MPKMPKVPKMSKIVERAFSTIDLISKLHENYILVNTFILKSLLVLFCSFRSLPNGEIN